MVAVGATASAIVQLMTVGDPKGTPLGSVQSADRGEKVEGAEVMMVELISELERSVAVKEIIGADPEGPAVDEMEIFCVADLPLSIAPVAVSCGFIVALKFPVSGIYFISKSKGG